MKAVKAPENYDDSLNMYKIFLAGSIDMGEAEDWQTALTNELKNFQNLLVLNPRRDDWDSSWKQTPEDEQFNQQVTWEMDGQEKADLNVFHFSSNSKSPITLLELGLYGPCKDSIVFCPDDFYRMGNVAMVCDRYNIPLTKTKESFMNAVKMKLALEGVK